MKIKHFLLGVLLVLIGHLNVYSQSSTITDVIKFNLQSVGPIVTDAEVSGYYLFYEKDKVNRKIRAYELIIMDQNLNKIGSHMIEASKYTYVLDAGFNNDHLMLKLYDIKEKSIIFKEFDANAKNINSYEREVSSLEKLVLNQQVQTSSDNDMGFAPSLYPIKNVGFVDYRAEKLNKHGFVIDFYSKSGKKWRVDSNDSDLLEMATFIYGDENIILSNVIARKSLFSKDTENYLLAIDTKSGKVLYKKQLEHKLFDLLVLNGLESDAEGNIHLFGSFYEKGDKEFKSSSLGLFAMKLNQKGEIISENLMSWANDLGKFLDVNHQGKIKDVGYLFIHDIVRNADGNVYVIGEQFRKAADGFGIAASVLSGRDEGVVKMVTEDLNIIELNSEYKIQGINIIDKEKTNISLPSGAVYYGAHMLSYIVKSKGGFDYEFTQFNSDKSIFTIGYTDYKKIKGSPDKIILGAVNYVDSERSHDEIDLNSQKNKSPLRVLPGKTGNYVVLEYNKSERSIQLELKKIAL
ncbi:DUF6770 family protein [Marinigracilibium pacificum]|uniref:Uncharacterized protein n=1 Tax=Marinigracilibium pacificum TaxID=2729599 RepID=A0A848IVN3_9BACT|nr:DUF6770 family protein [Marinigracilibium pacificum]NMM48543.1 hypothetical protein [Marinigracilibium pacificum]